MGFLQKGASAIGRLIIVGVLAFTFVVGMFGVIYLQLKGEEIKIPKVVGKNFNIGVDELALSGLRVKKIASRYSEEKPNTILEQRPRAGTTAKTGLTVSVVVSQPNPDGSEAPADVKDDEEAIEEIEELPELKTEKRKKKSKKKPKAKTRDVIVEKPKDKDPKKPEDAASAGDQKTLTKPVDQKSAGDKKTGADKKTPPPVKPKNKKVIVIPKPAVPKPKTNGDTRKRKVKKSN